MSAQQIFAYCFDCKELHYGIADANGVYSRESGSSNHFGHNVHVFSAPNDYVPPIRQVLTKLRAMAEISHNEMVLFKLAIALGELEREDPKEQLELF